MMKEGKRKKERESEWESIVYGLDGRLFAVLVSSFYSLYITAVTAHANVVGTGKSCLNSN